MESAGVGRQVGSLAHGRRCRQNCSTAAAVRGDGRRDTTLNWVRVANVERGAVDVAPSAFASEPHGHGRLARADVHHIVGRLRPHACNEWRVGRRRKQMLEVRPIVVDEADRCR